MRVVSVDFHCVFECERTKLSDLQLKTHLSAVPELEELRSCLSSYIQCVPKTSVLRVPSKSADISSWSAELILRRQDWALFTAQLVPKKAHVDRFQGCTRSIFKYTCLWCCCCCSLLRFVWHKVYEHLESSLCLLWGIWFQYDCEKSLLANLFIFQKCREALNTCFPDE